MDTRDENRDNHLRTNDFFDVENHPDLDLHQHGDHSRRAATEWKVVGDLTIRG